MKLKTLLLVLLALLCSSQHIYAESLGDCFNALQYDNELQPISDKVALGRVGEVSFSMLANEATATPNEAQAIYKWAIKRERCFKSDPPPNNIVTHVVTDGFNTVQSLLLDLHKGAITYGQFNRQCQEIMRILTARIQEIAGQQQQQQFQQQQYQQQQEEYLDQACLNRARSQIEKASCGMERAGRDIGRMLTR